MAQKKPDCSSRLDGPCINAAELGLTCDSNGYFEEVQCSGPQQ